MLFTLQLRPGRAVTRYHADDTGLAVWRVRGDPRDPPSPESLSAPQQLVCFHPAIILQLLPATAVSLRHSDLSLWLQLFCPREIHLASPRRHDEEEITAGLHHTLCRRCRRLRRGLCRGGATTHDDARGRLRRDGRCRPIDPDPIIRPPGEHLPLRSTDSHVPPRARHTL